MATIGFKRATAAAAAVALVGTGALWAPSPAAATTPAAAASGTRVPGPHLMPKAPPGPRNTSAPAGAQLAYYGGPVISNVKVESVYWGTGTYLPQTRPSDPDMPAFFQAVTNSAYFDWLSQYNTTTQSGTRTNQIIGRGGFDRATTITPAPANNGSTIDDSNMQQELAAQLTAGTLPAPQTDGAGHVNSLYALFFPGGKTLTQGGSSGGVAGGFCAYHGTIAYHGLDVPYMVLPSFTDAGYQTGCGAAPTTFGNFTSVTSHELVESTTDPAVGLVGNTNAPPLAWYDNSNGEIGDICNAQQGTIAGYVVQLQFSNVDNNCILTRSSGDFSLAANPASLTVPTGGQGVSTISTTAIGSPAPTVTFSASGVPSGASVSFSPASVTAGASSTLTLNAGTAAAGTYSVTVTGAGGGTSHPVVLSVTIGTPANDFAISANPSAVSVVAGSAGSSTISTAVTLGTAQTISLSAAGVPAGATASFSPPTVTAGQSSTLTINSGSAPAGTSTVTVSGTAASVTHVTSVALTITPNNAPGVTNGGFETGTLSGWTSTGSAGVVSTPHSGSFAARLGGTAPTNGDSTLTQTFTAPQSSTARLSLYYKVSCPDTLTYDWATVTIRDNTTSAVTTVVPKTCTNSGQWVNASTNLSSGHGYTLTLLSHDDNYASDPTFTLFDDVSLIAGPPAPSGITNGMFETGDLSGWTPAGTATVLTGTACHSGTHCARLGSTSPTHGDSSIRQTFTVGGYAATLSFWDKPTCPDTLTYDWSTATLTDTTVSTTATPLPKTCATAGWTQVTAPLTANHSYTLTLTSHDDNYASDPTYTLFDDVTVTAASAVRMALSPPVSQVQTPSQSFSHRTAASTQQSYTAELVDSNGVPITDVTSNATFTIAPDGFCQGSDCVPNAGGTHTVTATYKNETATATMVATAAALASLVLSPANATISADVGSQAYTAEGFDSTNADLGDVTAATTFAIAPDGTCTGAVCTAASIGTHTITATDGTVTATTSLTITPGALAKLVLTPARATVVTGGAQPYRAEGFDRGGNDLGDVTAATTFTIAPDGSCSAATCTPSAPGDHTVTGQDGTVTGTADLLADGALTARAPALILAVGGVNATVATFTDADPAGTVSDFTATIDWGDGTVSPGVISPAGGGFAVQGAHRYRALLGIHAVTVHISDSGGATATARTLIVTLL